MRIVRQTCLGRVRRPDSHRITARTTCHARAGTELSQAVMQQYTVPLLQCYHDDHSLFCSKVLVALLAKGVPFQLVDLPCGGTSSAEYRARVPLGKIPALVVQEQGEEEQLLMESEVIIEWLEDRFPSTGVHLLPADPRQRAMVRLVARFHDMYYEPVYRRLYSQVSPANRDPAVIASVLKELRERTQQLEQLISSVSSEGPYGAGPTLTLADCAYPGAFLYIDLIVPEVVKSLPESEQQAAWPGWPARLQAWQRALTQDPHVVEMMRRLRPAAQAWMEGKLGVQRRG